MTDAERLASLLWPEVFNRPFHDVARAQRAIDYLLTVAIREALGEGS